MIIIATICCALALMCLGVAILLLNKKFIKEVNENHKNIIGLERKIKSVNFAIGNPPKYKLGQKVGKYIVVDIYNKYTYELLSHDKWCYHLLDKESGETKTIIR